MQNKRSQKVAGLLKTEISNIINSRLKDPLVGFVTVTDLVLSDDLRVARVYISVLGDEIQKENSMKGLERARSFIQNELGSRVKLRYLPILHFYIDESWAYGENIDRILRDLHSNESSTSRFN